MNLPAGQETTVGESANFGLEITGSVGMSTVDLLKRGNGKYRVEAVTEDGLTSSTDRVAVATGPPDPEP